jgi:PTH1 family peptidyl-tRNA hydrolase
MLVIGLGNPGKEYERTRHNIGFMVADRLLVEKSSAHFSRKWGDDYTDLRIAGTKIWLVKPQTYMNRSGESVARFAGYFKVKPQDILVVHDDLDMVAGRVKVVSGGGAGGHNGIRSIIHHLGTKDFPRIKFGIGRPGDMEATARMPVERYVLTRFSSEESTLVDERISRCITAIEQVVQNGVVSAMNNINGL